MLMSTHYPHIFFLTKGFFFYRQHAYPCNCNNLTSKTLCREVLLIFGKFTKFFSIAKHSLQKFTHPLLNILFYSKRQVYLFHIVIDSENFYITFTEVLDEISIVLDEHLWALLVRCNFFFF